MATETLTCVRDGAPTQLTCAGCETPICPRCLVRTPVGLKCGSCSGRQERRTASRWIVPTALVAAAAVVTVAVVVVTSSGHKTPAGSPALAPASTIVASPDPGASDQATEGRLTFAISTWECGAKDVGPPPAVTALGQYCFLSFTVRNEGTSPDQFPGAFQYVIDDKGKRYGSDQKATQAYPAPGNKTLLDNHQINPGLTLEGVIVYDVPEGVKLVAAEFHRNPRTIGRRIDLPA